jgi:SAM-dependent methyltransferase
MGKPFPSFGVLLMPCGGTDRKQLPPMIRDVYIQSPYGPATVETVNARNWASPKLARRRARLGLRPAESGLLARYESHLRGHVLELGCAGGALTDSLVPVARSLTGLAPSAPMIERCSRRHPGAAFVTRDFRDLDAFPDDHFDAIVAGHRAIDVLGDVYRRRLLGQLNRVLADDGILIFSSHNLGCESLVRPPSRNFSVNPLRTINRLARLPRALSNRAHLARLQEREIGYAILNDAAHDYSHLHYYVSRDAQECQLADFSFELLECVTLGDAPVGFGDLAYGCPELYFASRPFA